MPSIIIIYEKAFAHVLPGFMLSQMDSKILLILTSRYQYNFGNHLWKCHHWNYMQNKINNQDINFITTSENFATTYNNYLKTNKITVYVH